MDNKGNEGIINEVSNALQGQGDKFLQIKEDWD